ncbi:MAG: hypothetical protein ACRDYZ_15495 [Acidimicrobiales bacterium]
MPPRAPALGLVVHEAGDGEAEPGEVERGRRPDPRAAAGDKEEARTTKTDVEGTTMPALEVSLEPGEEVVSIHGSLSWMTPQQRVQLPRMRWCRGRPDPIFTSARRTRQGLRRRFPERTVRPVKRVVIVAVVLPLALAPAGYSR